MPRTQPVRSTRQFVETAETEVPQGKPRIQSATGDAKESLEPFAIVEAERISQAKAEALKFAEDLLTVRFPESQNPTDDPFIEVWNDGTRVEIPKGQEVQVRRKYLETLLRARTTTYRQVKLPENGGYQNIPQTSVKHQFTIISDPAGAKGSEWFRTTMAQG